MRTARVVIIAVAMSLTCVSFAQAKVTAADHQNPNERCPSVGRSGQFTYQYTGQGSNFLGTVRIGRNDAVPLAPGITLAIKSIDVQEYRDGAWQESPSDHPETVGPQRSGEYDGFGYTSAERDVSSYYKAGVTQRVVITYSQGAPYADETLEVAINPRSAPAGGYEPSFGPSYNRSGTLCLVWFNSRRTEADVRFSATEYMSEGNAVKPEIMRVLTYQLTKGGTHAKRLKLRRSCHTDDTLGSTGTYADTFLECRLRGIPRNLRWLQVVGTFADRDGRHVITKYIRR